MEETLKEMTHLSCLQNHARHMCKKYKDKKGTTAAEACGCVCGDFR